LFVYMRRYPRVYEGAQVAFSCRPATAEPFENFAFDKYAARRGIHFQCLYPYIEVVKPPSGFRAVLSRIKEFYSDQYTTLFHEPESTLAKAMMLARYQEMPQTLRTAYSRAGISHVISISGLHISIIALIFDTMLIAFGGSRRLRATFLSTGLTLYLIILGFPAPALRSVIMALLIVLSRIIGRPYHILHGLLLAATVMVLANPMVLMFDIGFQLSFLALAGIALTGEMLPHFLTLIPEAFELRSLVSMTLGAQLLTWPLIMYYFGIFSVVAPISNVLIVPLLAPVLVGGLVVPLLAPVPVLQLFGAWPFYFMLRGMTLIAQWSAALPWAAFDFDTFSVGHLALAYVLTGVFFFWIRKRSKRTPSELPWYVR
ncbi:MAG: ComEC/Rec2 family competence protein, partial [Patescibacteria group bacterium]